MYTIFMRGIHFIVVLFLFNLTLVRSYDNKSVTATKTDKRGNVPIIKSSSSSIYFEDQFQDEAKWSLWTKSQAKKDIDRSIARYDGDWSFEIPESSVYKNDYGLVSKSKAKHHAISVHLHKPFDFSTNQFIIQYEVKFQANQECGGAYIKLLSEDDAYLDLKQVTDRTPYTIMFGPDMCGVTHKYHFILRFRNPKTGLYNEHHAKTPTEPLDTYFKDKKSHLYTLILSDDNNFEMYIDNKLINSGNLLKDMTPAIIPPKHIFDETDKKPDDWDEREKIIDTKAKKPDDWDNRMPKEIIDQNAKIPDGWLENERLVIPDPHALKPEEWNDEIDGIWKAPNIENPRCKNAPGCGKWTPPMIPNPAYKGSWSPPLIDNPNYRGIWEPRKIPNPNYFEEVHIDKLISIGSITLEIWSMVDGIVFDNFLLTSNQSIAKQYADELWKPKSELEEKIMSNTSSSLTWDHIVDAFSTVIKTQKWLWIFCPVVIVLSILFTFVIYWSCQSRRAIVCEKITTKKNDGDENARIEDDHSTVKSTTREKLPVDDINKNVSSDSTTNKARRRK